MKKGQASITGFIITIVLIITVVSLFYTQFSLLLVKDSEYVDIRGDSEHVASVLVSEGFPKEWNTENVKKVGLLDGEKISLAKLTEFSSINYSTSKKLLGIRYDYMLFIEKDGKKQIVPGANKDFIGWNGYIETDRGNGGYPFESFFRIINQNAEHIAKNEKFIYIEDAVIDKAYAKLIIFTWDPVPGLDGMNTQCVDGIDNDGDLLIDWDDPGCDKDNPFDDDESNPPFDLGCRYVSGACDANETPIINISVGVSQHAALANSSAVVYPNKICCGWNRYINVSMNNDVCDNDPEYTTLVKLDNTENAHIQRSDESGYENKICMKGEWSSLDCAYEDPVCTDGRTCVFSMSADTNAHIGKCSDYNRKLCCRLDETDVLAELRS